MPNFLKDDGENIDRVLGRVVREALRFLSDLDIRAAGVTARAGFEPVGLPAKGVGTETALALFKERYEPLLSGTAGPRYFGFVTGGVTPAALAGDWLTSVYDQNVCRIVRRWIYPP